MNNEVNHITYNTIKQTVDIHFEDGSIKSYPMSDTEWESLFSNGPEYAMKKINELIYV